MSQGWFLSTCHIFWSILSRGGGRVCLRAKTSLRKYMNHPLLKMTGRSIKCNKKSLIEYVIKWGNNQVQVGTKNLESFFIVKVLWALFYTFRDYFESKDMHAIFPKKGKKGQKNVKKVKKGQNILKFGQKCNVQNLNKFWKRAGETMCEFLFFNISFLFLTWSFILLFNHVCICMRKYSKK